MTDLDTNPSMSVIKNQMSAGIAVGDLITYEIIVTNTGNVTLSNITVTDPNAVDPANAGAANDPNAVPGTGGPAGQAGEQAGSEEDAELKALEEALRLKQEQLKKLQDQKDQKDN